MFTDSKALNTSNSQKPKNTRTTKVATRIVTLILVIGIIGLAAAPALANQNSPGDFGEAIATIVEAITGIIQSVAIGLGVLGLSIWGLAKLARPIFPEISQQVQGYIPGLMIGLVVIFLATEIVEGLSSAIGV